MNNNQRVKQIDKEVLQLRKQMRDLLKERRKLVAPEYKGVAQIWGKEVIRIIQKHPGATRQMIVDELESYIPPNTLTNVLTTLRRRGQIENLGNRKHPRWVIILSETPNPN